MIKFDKSILINSNEYERVILLGDFIRILREINRKFENRESYDDIYKELIKLEEKMIKSIF